MRSPWVIVIQISWKQSFEMFFVKDDNVIQKFSSDTADHSFDIGILPWRRWRGDDFFRAKRPNSLLNLPAVAAIAISQQIARGGIEGKRLSKLLRRPLSRWMFRDVEMDDPAPIVNQDDQYK